MSRYRPDSHPPKTAYELADYLERQLWRISQAVEQQFDDEPVWDDIRVPVTATRVGAANAPDFAVFKGNIATYAFDGGTLSEYLHFAVQVPHGWQEGTTLEPHLHWTTVTATASAQVVWTLEYTWANVNGVFPATTTLTATGTCSISSYHKITGFDPDITATAGLISLMLLGRVGRDPTVAGDTFTGDAYLLEIDFHAKFDGNGSVKTFTKT